MIYMLGFCINLIGAIPEGGWVVLKLSRSGQKKQWLILVFIFKLHLSSIPSDFDRGSLLQPRWSSSNRSSLWAFYDITIIANAQGNSIPVPVMSLTHIYLATPLIPSWITKSQGRAQAWFFLFFFNAPWMFFICIWVETQWSGLTTLFFSLQMF